MIAALTRKVLWRTVFSTTGGLRVVGRLPDQPCVLVANHSSHADTAALLAALPAHRRPAVAAAADYWFDRPDRRLTRRAPDRQGPPASSRAHSRDVPLAGCGARWRSLLARALAGAFPVRRTGGGSADLAEAGAQLAAGRDVIVYPEGSRSRDGSVGAFHSGAARLADAAGAPLVPIGIGGTHRLLPVHGRVHRSRITIHIGQPVSCVDAARQAVVELATTPRQHRSPMRDSLVRQRVALFAGSTAGLVTMALWAFGEAMAWPLLPEFALVILGLAAPRQMARLTLVAAAASLAGGATMYLLAAHGVTLPAPLTTPLMHETAAAQVAAHGSGAVAGQPMSGIPYKVYGAATGQAHAGLVPFLVASAPARGLRIVIVGALTALVGVAIMRWRRCYPYLIALFVTVFSAGLAAVVYSWS